MKNLLILLMICICPMTNALASEPSALSQSEISALEKEVLKATMSRNSAFEAKDAELAYSYFSRSEGVVEVSRRGVKAISSKSIEGLSHYFETVDRMGIDFDQQNIRILGRSSALVFVEGTWWFIPKKSKEKVTGDFMMTLVWVKGNGGWKVVHKHESEPGK